MGADFDHCFVFFHSYGTGNPHYIELIEKETGKNIIEKGSAWIDADTTKGVLLYTVDNVPSLGDNMTLYDEKHTTRKKYAFPKQIFSETEVANRIKFKTITDDFFIIVYESGKLKKIEKYKRN